ncbi:MAG: VWA domain-containing protein [Pyrinomonadaceae bacterium]
MKKRPLLALTLAALIFVQNFSAVAMPQQSAAPPAPPTQQTSPTPQPDEDVVRITTNLVQVDAIVIDKKTGKQVTDLHADDFAVYEDERPQKLTNFSYINIQPAAMTATITAPSSGKNAPPFPSARLRPDQVRRTIALIVDDLSLSFESTAYVRIALKNFIDEQMQPNDLVAVLRTSAGIGALQQFTSDKRQLYAAVERVRWNPAGRGGVSAFAPLNSFDNAAKNIAGGSESAANASDTATGTRDDLDSFREELFSIGTLGAVNFVVRGLRELPGRKSVVLFSDGIRIFNKSGESGRALEALRRLTDLANRSSAVFYTLDARGLQPLGLSAEDSTTDLSSEQVEKSLADRRADYFESQNGLNYLAQQTGGFFIRNTNDLGRGLRRVLEDQSGYYLIGYRPDDSTFDPATGRRKFHRLKVSVKNHPEYRVRTRNGFYGITNEDAHPVLRTRQEQLMAALTSPFSSGEMRLRLTSLFGNDEKAGSFMRSLLYIDGHDLSFKEEAGGWHKAVVDIAAFTFGDNGRVIDPVNRTETIRARGEEYQRLLQSGLLYVINVPVKKPGAYQLRAAVRDAGTERVGSASQFIEVPNLEKNRLALSGIVVTGSTNAQTSIAPASGKSDTSPAAKNVASSAQAQASPSAPPDNARELWESMASPGVRRLRQGMIMDCGYVIYDAQLDRATHQPQLQTQLRLFRDGQPVFVGSLQPVNTDGQSDLKRISVGRRLQLGTALPPGEYILQVIVTDALAKEKYRTATQYIDFEIVKQ